MSSGSTDLPVSGDRANKDLMDRYEGNRVLRALVQLIPFGVGGAADVVLAQTAASMREERTRAFFEELERTKVPLAPDLLKSEDFVHRYFITARYALNSRRHDKIRMFARLLARSVVDLSSEQTDRYEWLASVLDDLEYRELLALRLLDSYSGTPRSAEMNDLQWTSQFWADFEKRLCAEIGLQPPEVTGFMTRVARSGCFEMFTGGYFDYTGGKGKLTPIYAELKNLALNTQP